MRRWWTSTFLNVTTTPPAVLQRGFPGLYAKHSGIQVIENIIRKAELIPENIIRKAKLIPENIITRYISWRNYSKNTCNLLFFIFSSFRINDLIGIF